MFSRKQRIARKEVKEFRRQRKALIAWLKDWEEELGPVGDEAMRVMKAAYVGEKDSTSEEPTLRIVKTTYERVNGVVVPLDDEIATLRCDEFVASEILDLLSAHHILNPDKRSKEEKKKELTAFLKDWEDEVGPIPEESMELMEELYGGEKDATA